MKVSVVSESIFMQKYQIPKAMPPSRIKTAPLVSEKGVAQRAYHWSLDAGGAIFKMIDSRPPQMIWINLLGLSTVVTTFHSGSLI
jgi:hypothetical protein